MRDRAKTLYLMQGVPGSGKSSIARMIQAHHNEDDLDVCVTVSTDDFRLDEDGSYIFDAKDNGRFHRLAQQRCAQEMTVGRYAIIIDNTNIQEWQARPYLVLADIFGYVVQVVSVDCGLKLAIERQGERDGLGDRAVPPFVISDMYGKMERLLT